MTTLGEILDQLHDPAEVYQMLVDSGDVMLISELNRMADETREDPCEIALRAVRAFTGKADDEAWIKLVGHVQDSPSPAGTCLREMIVWSIKQ